MIRSFVGVILVEIQSMKRSNRLPGILLVLVAAILLVSGCGRTVVKDEKTFDLEPGVPHILYIPPCKKFEVSFATKDNVPVSAYVVSKADGEESEKAAALKGQPKSIKDNASNDRISSPESAAKVEWAVVFISKKKTGVTARISGQ